MVFAKYGSKRCGRECDEVEVDGEKLLLMRAEDIYAKYAE